ncbi:MAG: TIGR04282 family arsenosugar biosynthesis glycosyltransferase [Gemmatimonadaceae bacterium]|nr:TIGR04282 family arsenosugar biosynthesis glycosyltransferase [Acetobacteraceae bacterium]
MRDTVIVFARVPQLGTVKRRLARDIGDRAALRFYRGNLARLLRALVRDPRFRTVLAVTPDRGQTRWPVPVAWVPQGGGDLGQRMHRACARHGRVAIVGTDIPALGPDHVAAAFRALGRAQAVFGPSDDGGYWLVALSPRRPGRPFGDVRWSTEFALQDTLANFRGRPVALLGVLRDVDTGADLAALRPQLSSLSPPPLSSPSKAR